MSAVQQALSNLSRALGNLESAADQLEASRKGEQRDMFATPAPRSVANSNNIDTEQVAKRLDLAIAHIETVLKEGRA